MTSKAAAITRRNSPAYKYLPGYADVIEQVIRASWDTGRLVVEMECLDRDDDYRALRGWEPATTTNGRRTACADILHAINS